MPNFGADEIYLTLASARLPGTFHLPSPSFRIEHLKVYFQFAVSCADINHNTWTSSNGRPVQAREAEGEKVAATYMCESESLSMY